MMSKTTLYTFKQCFYIKHVWDMEWMRENEDLPQLVIDLMCILQKHSTSKS